MGENEKEKRGSFFTWYIVWKVVFSSSPLPPAYKAARYRAPFLHSKSYPNFISFRSTSPPSSTWWKSRRTKKKKRKERERKRGRHDSGGIEMKHLDMPIRHFCHLRVCCEKKKKVQPVGGVINARGEEGKEWEGRIRVGFEFSPHTHKTTTKK